jgi:excisionase family DNA binding protein
VSIAVWCSVSEVVSFELPEPHRKRLVALVSGIDGGGAVALRTDQGEAELPPEARAAVRQLLADLAAGSAVHLLTDDSELTTQEAADILGISRTYIVRLIDDDKLPARLVGTHRRLRAADVLAYKARRDARLAGVDAIAAADAAAGVPYR